jgi:hypothetical protein
MQLSDEDQQALNRAEAADRIMQDPLVLEALSLIDEQIHELWASGPLTAADREELHRILQAKNRFIQIFEGYLQNGAAARQMLGIEPPSKTFLQRIKEYLK